MRAKKFYIFFVIILSIVVYSSLSAACSSGCATKTYTLTYTAGVGGHISDSSIQSVNCSANGTAVTAVANSCYHFVNWSDGVTTASRVDTDVRNNITVNANFVSNGTYTLTYIAGLGGSISGPSTQTVDCSTRGSPVEAIASTNYLFVNWSDGHISNPRTDAHAISNVAVTANFVNVTLIVEDINDIKSKISKIVVGHADGTTVRLFSGSLHFDEIAQEAILVALGIDVGCNCVFDFQTPEELAEFHKDFVYVYFKYPTVISTIGGREQITTNELILWPRGYPLPSMEPPLLPTEPLVWANCHSPYCGGWSSSRNMDALGDLTDNLND